MHESNGLGIITALILNDINPLGKVRMDLVLELKNNASKLLLAIMESRSSDPENVAEKIIYNMNPRQLVSYSNKYMKECQFQGIFLYRLMLLAKLITNKFWMRTMKKMIQTVMTTQFHQKKLAIIFIFYVINWPYITKNWDCC